MPPTPQLTASDRLVQFIIGLLRSRITPVLTSLVGAWITKLALVNPSASELNTEQIVAVLTSVLIVLSTWALNAVVRLLTKHVKVFQTLLVDKGVPISADGWFGNQSLVGAVAAINAPNINITPADKASATQEAK